MREITSTGGMLITFMAVNVPKFSLLLHKVSIYVSGKEGKALACEEMVIFF